MDKVKCRYCKKEIKGNPKYVLQEISMMGYTDLDFDSLICFLKFIMKKYRKKLWKMGY